MNHKFRYPSVHFYQLEFQVYIPLHIDPPIPVMLTPHSGILTPPGAHNRFRHIDPPWIVE
jgi:hypothetical protein